MCTGAVITSTPQGAARARCSMSSRTRLLGIRARRDAQRDARFRLGMRLLEAPSVGGASSPMAVTDGFDQRREASVPVPIRPTPGSTPAAAR